MRTDYRLHEVDNGEFEMLVLRICTKWFGEAVTPFAAGKDGGRDGKFFGTASSFPSTVAPFTGHFVFQAKHVAAADRSCSDRDFELLLKKEHSKIKRLIALGICDHYVVFTNRKYTAGADEKLVDELLKLGLVSATIVGLERLALALDDYPEIRNKLSNHKVSIAEFKTISDTLASIMAAAPSIERALIANAPTAALHREIAALVGSNPDAPIDELLKSTLAFAENYKELQGEDSILDITSPSIRNPSSKLTPLAASLLGLLKKSNVHNALLYRVYLRSLPDPTREVGDVSIERWLEDLSDSRGRKESFPGPLIEFGERLARELNDKKLKNWVRDATSNALNQRASLYAVLDAEQLAQRPKAALFLEFGDTKVDGTTELSWWIQSPDPDLCSTREVTVLNGDLSAPVAKLLPSILEQAERKVGHRYELVVSLVVPDRLLSSDLESVKIELEEDGLVGDPVPLNSRYPVTLHWSRRAKAKAGGAGGSINSWKRALTTLMPRIEAGGSAIVEWLEKSECEDSYQRFAEVTDRLLLAHGTAVWVGLGHLDINIDRAAAEVVGCLRAGVPCFFWLSQSPPADADIRSHLYELFKVLKASDAPIRIGKLRKAAKNSDLIASIHIVWDMPDHLPAAQFLESPF